MLYICFFGTVTLFIYCFFALRDEQRKKLKQRLSKINPHQEHPEDQLVEKKKSPIYKRIFSSLWKQFKRSFKRNMHNDREARIEIKLLQAGNPFQMTPVDYRLLQISVFVLLPVLTGIYGYFLQVNIGQQILMILAAVIVALFLPPYYLKLKISQRSKMALKELPDILDLLTVSLEAGLGFDSALSKLVSKKKGILPSEFQRCLEEIRLGKTRREALLGLKERVTLDEMKSLVSSILQAEKLGIGMVNVLRVQSQDVREQRKQRAEEAAMKAPIKMLFPLVLFIFPCLFIVLLGPAVIQFLETFSK